MLRGIYSSISSMLTLQARQSVITNNLANINTTGYKEETLVGKSFNEVLLSNKDNYINGRGHTQVLGSMSFGVRIDETATNYTQGSTISTENNMDFAIEGRGFFQVSDNQNNSYYTRDGSFRVDADGYLITNSGYYVMGTNNRTGNTERIYVGNGEVTLDSDNKISINGNSTYNFRIIDFDNYDNLAKQGNGLYVGQGGLETDNVSIKQGYLESSNVDSTTVIASLMETVKEFEANQRIIKTYDSILSKIANDIGSV